MKLAKRYRHHRLDHLGIMTMCVRSMPIVAMMLLLSLIMTGCTVKVGGGSKTVNEVVTENLELRKEVKDLNEQLELRMAEIKALQQQAEAGKEPIPGAEPPVLSRIKLGRYSGPISTDGEDGDSKIVAYVQPEDQFARMLPVAGVATLQVVYIPDEGEPRFVIDQRYNAKNWREAYRSNFTGTHYTLKADLPVDMPAGTFDCTLRVTFRQADTGSVFSAQLPIKIMRSESIVQAGEVNPEDTSTEAADEAAGETPEEIKDQADLNDMDADSQATESSTIESSDENAELKTSEPFKGNDARPDDPI